VVLLDPGELDVLTLNVLTLAAVLLDPLVLGLVVLDWDVDVEFEDIDFILEMGLDAVLLVFELDDVGAETARELVVLVDISPGSLVVDVSLEVEDGAEDDDKLIGMLVIDVPRNEVVVSVLIEELVVWVDAVSTLVVVLEVLVVNDDIELSLLVVVVCVEARILVVEEVDEFWIVVITTAVVLEGVETGVDGLQLVVVAPIVVLVLAVIEVDKLWLVLVTSMVVVVLVSVTELVMDVEDEVQDEELPSLVDVEVEVLGDAVLVVVLVRDPAALFVEVVTPVDVENTVFNIVDVGRLVDGLSIAIVIDV
jgi:hypothetical protein